jgi:hypothetical protein
MHANRLSRIILSVALATLSIALAPKCCFHSTASLQYCPDFNTCLRAHI